MSATSKGLVVLSLFASFGAVSTAANAEDMSLNAEGQRMIKVSYSELNLDNISGQRALENRISAAARKVCGSTTGHVSLQESMQTRTCVKRATQTALASLNSTGQVQVAARAKSSASR